MAIAFDATSSGFTNSATSVTFSHTCTGSDRILFVGVMVASGTTISSVTYNGTALTLINRSAGGQQCALYYLIAPSTGANNVVVSLGSTTYAYCASTSYTGAKQWGVPDASNTNSTTNTSVATSVTTVADNCWTVLIARNDTDGNTSAGTGSTIRVGSGSGLVQMYDSNATITPAASSSMTVTNVGSYPTTTAMASFAPSTADTVIARDAFTDRQGATGSSSLTFAHTCNGTNRYLLVNVRIDDTGSDVVTGVTYNSVAMTRILFKATDSGGRGIYQYYLIAPATGSNNVVVSVSGTHDIYAYTASYTGVKQSGQPDASKTDEATGASSLSTSLTTVAADCWTTAFIRFDTNNINGSTNYAVLGAADSFRFGDSNTTVGAAGAKTIAASGAGGSGEWDAIYSSMSPAVAAASSSRLALLGIG